MVDEIWGGVADIAGQAQALIAGEARSVDVKVEVAGRRVTGTVPGVRGSVLGTVTYSKVNPRHRIGAWVRLLALCATGEAYSSATIGRASGAHGRVTVARVPALSRDDALAQLAVLIDLYDRGLREPLPLACRTSAAFAAGGNARGEWESDRFPKEDRERRARARLRRLGLVRVAAGGGAARRRALGPGGAHALRPVRAAVVARAAGGRGDRRA